MSPYRPIREDLLDATRDFYRLLNKSDAPWGFMQRLRYGFTMGLYQFGMALILSSVILTVFSFLPHEPKNWVSEEASTNPDIYLFLIIAVAAPILEEGIFRSWLGRISYFIPLFFCTVYLVAGTGFEAPSKEEIVSLEYLSLIGITAVPSVFCIVQLLRGKMYFNPSPSQLRIIFWVSVVIFGLFHAGNYVNDDFPLWYVLLLSPLLLSPQIVGGYILGVCRIRAGLVSSMLAHSVNNSISVLGIFIGSQIEEQPAALMHLFSLLSW